MRILLILAIAYLIGSIPSGYLVVRAKEGEDVRRTGSGGTGATNVSRLAGKGAGILTLILDVIKGAFVVFLAGLLSDGLFPLIDWTIAFAGLLAILGHIFPVFLRFRGGKGVATALGVFVVIAPLVVVIALLVFAATFALTRFVSLASLVAISSIAVTILLLSLFDPLELPYAIGALLSAGLVIFAHRENIQRLWRGTEPKFS